MCLNFIFNSFSNVLYMMTFFVSFSFFALNLDILKMLVIANLALIALMLACCFIWIIWVQGFKRLRQILVWLYVKPRVTLEWPSNM